MGKYNNLLIQYPDSSFYKAPEEALLYLKDHTLKNDERIFECKNGK